MVSYYNPAVMYRHQQAVSPTTTQFHANPPMHSWYTPGYHQGAQINGAPPNTYCMQEEQQMWHHSPHGVFHNEFSDFVMNGMQFQQHHHQMNTETQLPSPPTTVSGSEMSSPGGATGTISPQNNVVHNARPPPARSPYEWIKKTSYQSQPNPGKTRTKDKYRVVYTDHQRVELEKEFYYSRYITIRRKAELASNLGLSERQVKIWFQNRRAKERKQVKKRDELSNNKDVLTPHITQEMMQSNGIMPVQLM